MVLALDLQPDLKPENWLGRAQVIQLRLGLDREGSFEGLAQCSWS